MDSFQIIDQTFHEFLLSENFRDDWLLWQTLFTGNSRRSWLKTLPFISTEDSSRVPRILDVGTGFGALAFDLASFQKSEIIGIDFDPDKVNLASKLFSQLQKNSFSTESDVSFQEGNVYHLNFPSHSFDFVFARFVFQHLSDPLAALQEIYRVLKPNGSVYIAEIDDGISFLYPPHESYETLKSLFEKVQTNRGGDRWMGRKLPGLLHQTGFFPKAVVHNLTRFNDEKQDILYSARELELVFLTKRLESIREEAISLGFIDKETFEQHVKSLESYCPEFELESQFFVSGQKLSTHFYQNLG